MRTGAWTVVMTMAFFALGAGRPPVRAGADSPELARAQAELARLRNEQHAVLARYEAKEISRQDAKAELVVLIEDERRIVEDPGYQAELRLRSTADIKKTRAEMAGRWQTHSRMQEDLRKRLKAAPVK